MGLALSEAQGNSGNPSYCRFPCEIYDLGKLVTFKHYMTGALPSISTCIFFHLNPTIIRWPKHYLYPHLTEIKLRLEEPDYLILSRVILILIVRACGNSYRIWTFCLTPALLFLSFFFFSYRFYFPFSSQSHRVHSCIFLVMGPSCGMWDATSAWLDEWRHV